MACNVCMRLFDGALVFDEFQQHHSSLMSLKSSASSGCYICHTILRVLLKEHDSEENKQHDESSFPPNTTSLTIAKFQNYLQDYEMISLSFMVPAGVYVFESTAYSLHSGCYVWFGVKPVKDLQRVLLYHSVQESILKKSKMIVTILSMIRRKNALPVFSNALMQIEPRTDSDTTFQLLRLWLRNCRLCHSCKKVKSNDRPSFHLLELHEPASDMCRLIDIPHGTNTIDYATLSHCWGSLQLLKLSTSTLETFRSGIKLSILPKTFVDAVTVATKLYCKFLWIDSLCIIQDDEADWEQQSSRMAFVYANSLFNIAAANASDSSFGLFRSRNSRLVRPCTITTRRSNGDNLAYHIYDQYVEMNELRTGPLVYRGWVQQELLLAPRILYFHECQIWWECTELIACETWPVGLPGGSKTGRYTNGIGGPPTNFQSHRNCNMSALSERTVPMHILAARWETIIDRYTLCNLTRPEDKLIALSGIAKHAQIILNDEYLAGLWKKALPHQLLWHRQRASEYLKKSAVYRAPTWSWASVDGHISSGRYHTAFTLIHILKVSVTPKSSDVTGQVVGGFIKMSAPLIKISTRQLDSETYYQKSWAGHGAFTSNSILEFEFTFDTGRPLAVASYYIVLYVYQHWQRAIVLEKVPSQKGYFKRCGVVEISIHENLDVSTMVSEHITFEAIDWCESDDGDGYYTFTII